VPRDWCPHGPHRFSGARAGEPIPYPHGPAGQVDSVSFRAAFSMLLAGVGNRLSGLHDIERDPGACAKAGAAG
jgi:hypothetical protein